MFPTPQQGAQAAQHATAQRLAYTRLGLCMKGQEPSYTIRLTHGQTKLAPHDAYGGLQTEEQLKKRVGAKLEVAKFLQDTVSEMAKDMRSSKTGAAQASAADLYQFMKRVRPFLAALNPSTAIQQHRKHGHALIQTYFPHCSCIKFFISDMHYVYFEQQSVCWPSVGPLDLH